MFDTVSSFGGMILLIIFTAIIGCIYQFVLKSWFYFNERNVKFIRGLPLLGSNYKSMIGLEPAAISYRRLYERSQNEKFIGIYDIGGQPSYLIRDPDLIKQLFITDVEHFTNPKSTFENDLFAQALFGMRASNWYKKRSTLNPIISTKQMKIMHELMVKSSEQFIDTLKKTDKIAKIFNSRNLFTRYANDVITAAAFGIRMNSMLDKHNDFFEAGHSMNEFRCIDGLKFLANISFPSLVQLLDVHVTAEKNTNNVRNIIKEHIEARRKDTSNTHDMIDLLIKARDNKLDYNDIEDNTDIGFAATVGTSINNNNNRTNEKRQNWTDDDVLTQCLIFFLGELSSVTGPACFMFHELSLNPDIQEKLLTEINQIKAELNGTSLTYEMIPKLKYLDMVVCETLRRWSPVPFLERTCHRPYVLQNNGEKLEINVGNGIFVPTYALHMDEKYFPKAIKFDPERFSDENKRSIRTGTYLPFGINSGNCIGSRFAIMTIKTLAFHLISEFFVDQSYKTQDPLKLKALPLLMDAEKGFFIELRRRDPDRSPYKSQVFT